MSAHDYRPSDPNMWWACDYPERPFDSHTLIDETCPRCCIYLHALARQNPDETLRLEYDDGALVEGPLTAADAAERWPIIR